MWPIFERGKLHAEFLWGNLKEQENLEDLSVEGRLVLKQILKKIRGRPCALLIWLGTGASSMLMVNVVNEPSCSIKCRQFLD